jgi:hypothetical protein
LGNADLPGKLGYAARRIDGTIKGRIAHVDLPSTQRCPKRLIIFREQSLGFGREPVN